MKVFISWSGKDSKQVAQLLTEWIPDVLQGVETWISSDDIDKGAVWMNDINEQLKEIGLGILCLTRNNIDAPWILFEAGALSKGLTKNRVCPLLINLSHKELKPPLASFMATMPAREDMLKLIKTINAQLVEKRLPDDRVEKSFDVWWGGFEKKFAAIVKDFKPSEKAKVPAPEEMIAEILELARSIQAKVQQSPAFQPALVPSEWLGVHNPHSHLGISNPDAWFAGQALPRPINDIVDELMKKNPEIQRYITLPSNQTNTASSD
jgi:hypothetical protein